MITKQNIQYDYQTNVRKHNKKQPESHALNASAAPFSEMGYL